MTVTVIIFLIPLLAQARGVRRTPVLQQGAAGAAALVQLILQRTAIVLLYTLPVPVVLVTVHCAVRKRDACDAVQNIVANAGICCTMRICEMVSAPAILQ